VTGIDSTVHTSNTQSQFAHAPLLCLRISNKQTATAAATFSDSVAAASGMVARLSTAATNSGAIPLPSLPNNHVIGLSHIKA
jgi:hypothetical protein